MAEADLPTHKSGEPGGYYGGTHANYATLHALFETAFTAGSGIASENNWFTIQSRYIIYRGLFTVDLTSLSAPLYISEAYLDSPAATIWATHRDFYVTLLDGRDIHGESGDFRILRDRTTPLGLSLIEFPVDYGVYEREVPLNEAGIALLESCAGGILTLGLRGSCEIDVIEPGYGETENERQYFSFKTSAFGDPDDRTYLHVVYVPNPAIVIALPATLITHPSARLNGQVTEDGGSTCECRFRYRSVRDGSEYTLTGWENSKEEEDEFSKDISGLASSVLYEFAAQAKNAGGEGPWSASKYFTTLSPRATVEIVDGTALEYIRTMEVSGGGRFFIDPEGKATYKSRFARIG